MLYKLQANSYKFSWLLIPISLPFVWLLFAWKLRYKAYDHTIFITYSLSFMTLLFVLASVAGSLGMANGWLIFILAMIAPLHLYKQLRGAYQLGRYGSIWRLIALIVCIIAILTIFAQILVVLGML